MTSRLLREYMEIVRDNLLEAINYDDMLNPIVKAVAADETLNKETRDGVVSKFQSSFKDNLAWAKKTLKKNDRIVWYMRWWKLAALNDDAFSAVPAVATLADAEMKKVRQRIPDFTANDLSALSLYASTRLRGTLEHFFSMPIHGIQTYQFNWQTVQGVLRDFKAMEAKWQAMSRHHIPYEDAKVVIDFPDGFKWVLLDRAVCRAEGKAMGHCGNSGSPKRGDQILSLRKITKSNEGKKVWEPFCTFILNNGMLGEMKGRFNEKPAASFHPYIVKLLEHDIIDGINGGGYKPEQNFAMSDLPDEVQDHLIDMKPALATPEYQFKKFGMTDDLARLILGKLDAGGVDYEGWNDDKTLLRVHAFRNHAEMVEEIGDDTAKWIMGVWEGGDHLDFYEGVSDDGRRDILEKLPKEGLAKLKEYVAENYPDALEDNGYESADELDIRDIVSILDDEGDDIYSNLGNAVETGLRFGAESEMSDALTSAINDAFTTEDADELGCEPRIVFDSQDGKLTFDKKVWMVLTAAGAAALASEEGRLEAASNGWTRMMKIEVDEPRYGWSGYDEEAAVEDFLSNHPEFGKAKPQAE